MPGKCSKHRTHHFFCLLCDESVGEWFRAMSGIMFLNATFSTLIDKKVCLGCATSRQVSFVGTVFENSNITLVNQLTNDDRFPIWTDALCYKIVYYNVLALAARALSNEECWSADFGITICKPVHFAQLDVEDGQLRI